MENPNEQPPAARPVLRKAKGTRRWQAWAGDRERLTRVAQAADALIAEHRGASRAQAEKKLAQVEDPEFWANRFHDPADWVTWLTAVEHEFALTHEGEAQGVLDSVDPLTIKRVTIEAPRGILVESKIIVNMSEEGCALEVRGDPQWVRGSYETMRSELAKGAPWWRWMRDLSVSAVTGAVVSGVLGAAFLAPALVTATRPLTRLQFAFGVMGVSVGWLLGVIVLHPAVRRILPGFEITTGPPRGRGARAIAIGLGAVGSVAAGLFVALITR